MITTGPPFSSNAGGSVNIYSPSQIHAGTLTIVSLGHNTIGAVISATTTEIVKVVIFSALSITLTSTSISPRSDPLTTKGSIIVISTGCPQWSML